MRNNLIILSGLIALSIGAGINAYHEIPEPVPTVTYSEAHDAKLMDSLLSEVEQENLLRAVEQVESHGDPNALSPKGAKGRWQLMDNTAKKPGMGVKPMKNRSRKEQKRFARDYLAALKKHYHGDLRLALAAYNGGVGRVDRALDVALASLPKETQEYVVKVELAMNEQ